jgi:hypothetical protein
MKQPIAISVADMAASRASMAITTRLIGLLIDKNLISKAEATAMTRDIVLALDTKGTRLDKAAADLLRPMAGPVQTANVNSPGGRPS